MVVHALVLAVFVSACGFSGSNTNHGADAMDPDGDNGGGRCTTWMAPDIGDPCNPAIGTPTDLHLTAGDYDLDTSTGMLTGAQSIALPGGLIGQSFGAQVRVVNVASLMLDQGAQIFAHGDNALVFVVHGAVTIDGMIDVAAKTSAGTSTPGPGGNPTTVCMAAAMPGAAATGNAAAGGGGGGGGAYGTDDAGNGGDGKGGMHGLHGTKGGPNGDPQITGLRGGCPGGAGGDDQDNAANNGGRKGDGGGAIEITALGSITISGVISAGGSGGGGATAGPGGGGGGGGGSGGAILLDGRSVSIPQPAVLCANGGGGGQGGFTAAVGEDGKNALCDSVKAPGGAMNADGGAGGDGAFAMTKGTDAKPPPTNSAGGGGGGGGVGRIRAHARMGAPQLSGTVTPPAVML